FDTGGSAADNMALLGGAAFAADVPQGAGPGATPTATPTPIVGASRSLSLNGTTAYGEAPNAAELNPASWTFEVWVKDENPTYDGGTWSEPPRRSTPTIGRSLAARSPV